MSDPLVKLIYNPKTSEGVVKFSEEFKSAHIVFQQDLLQDWIVELTDVYNELIANENCKVLENE